jgi:hypothetical protein
MLTFVGENDRLSVSPSSIAGEYDSLAKVNDRQPWRIAQPSGRHARARTREARLLSREG